MKIKTLSLSSVRTERDDRKHAMDRTGDLAAGHCHGRSMREAGNAIFVTLVIAGVVALTLAAYLSWADTQSKMSMRSQCWNAALPVSEAGLEEALTQLHYTGLTNLTANGWTSETNGWYFKRNNVNGRAYYEVHIKRIQPPVIVSTGYMPIPLATNSYVKRRVRVTTRGGSTIGAAIVSKSTINLSGNNVTIDSFDSCDPNYNTGGKYDAAKSRDGGNVICLGSDGLTANNKPIYALDVGDADIRGHVEVLPGATINLTSGGSVGSEAWVDAGTQGIEPGWASTEANVGIDNVEEPFTGGYFTPTQITGNKVPYNYVFDLSGNYKMADLTGKVLVSASNVTVWATDSVNIGSGEFIQITTGASLKLYVSAASAVIAGQGVINDSGLANAFQYYGLPSNTAIDYKGNSTFYGMIKAPQATLKLGGGGTTDYDFNGSIIVGSLTMNGHYHVHYDECLQRLESSALVVGTWNEVDANGPIQ